MNSQQKVISTTNEKDSKTNTYSQNYTLNTNEAPIAPINPNKTVDNSLLLSRSNNSTINSPEPHQQQPAQQQRLHHRSKFANLIEKSMNTVASIIHTPHVHGINSPNQRTSENNSPISLSSNSSSTSTDNCMLPSYETKFSSPSTSPPKHKAELTAKKLSRVSSVKNSLLNSFKSSRKPKFNSTSAKSKSLPLSSSSSLQSTLEDAVESNHVSDNSSNDTIKGLKHDQQQLAKTPSTDLYPPSLLSNNSPANKINNKSLNLKNKPIVNAFLHGSSFSSSTSTSSPPSPTHNNIKNVIINKDVKFQQKDDDDIFEENFDELFENNRRVLSSKKIRNLHHAGRVEQQLQQLEKRSRMKERAGTLNSKAASGVCAASNSWSLNTDYDEEDFMDAFRIFDTDGDGKITAKELNHVLKELGIKMSKHDIKKMIKELDNDGNGTIEYSEFVQMMTMPASRDADEFELREAFKCIDLDGNGFISREELKDAVKKIMSTDSKISVQDVEEMMSEADTDGNGLIDFDEFVRVLVEKRN